MDSKWPYGNINSADRFSTKLHSPYATLYFLSLSLSVPCPSFFSSSLRSGWDAQNSLLSKDFLQLSVVFRMEESGRRMWGLSSTSHKLPLDYTNQIQSIKIRGWTEVNLSISSKTLVGLGPEFIMEEQGAHLPLPIQVRAERINRRDRTHNCIWYSIAYFRAPRFSRLSAWIPWIETVEALFCRSLQSGRSVRMIDTGRGTNWAIFRTGRATEKVRRYATSRDWGRNSEPGIKGAWRRRALLLRLFSLLRVS